MKYIIFSVLCLISINVFAVSWKKVNENPTGDSYVDVDSLNKLNNIVYYLRLFDYFEPSPIGVHSSISKFKVDCIGEKITWISSTYFSEPKGKGEILKEKTSNKVLYVRPGAGEYVTMKFVCNYKQMNT